MENQSNINAKLVSVIIPSYNAGKYISEAITSVINQEYTHWELIIIDDGSTDNTSNLVFQFLKDERIKYYRIENSGVSNARNYGAKLAKGEYFCFLDADDFFYPKNLFEKVNLLNYDSKIVMAHSDIQMTNEEGIPNGEINSGLSGENLHLDLLLWKRCVVPAPSSIMIRREIFYSVGEWDSKFSTAADQDFFIRVAQNRQITRINKTLTGYRIVNSSMSRNAEKFEKDHLGVFYKAKQNKLFPNKNFENKCFANLHLMIAGSWWKQNKKALPAIKNILLSLSYSPMEIFTKFKSKLR